MKGKKIFTNILSVQEIPNASVDLLKSLRVSKGYKSLGIVTTDVDDTSYAALDEATKKADVIVAYAKSMYAGAGNASMKLAGEFIGILAGDNPEEIRSGIHAFEEYLKNEAFFYTANDTEDSIYFAHCISRTGSYLSRQAGITEGNALAYLIAPPNEAICGLDAALKAANVELKTFYGPPTETNFAGGLLAGEQAACMAACAAFARRVEQVAYREKTI